MTTAKQPVLVNNWSGTVGMEHTVSYCLSRGLAKRHNEDLIGFFDNVFWLLDGASIPADISIHPTIDTVWYVRHLSLALSEIVCTDSNRSLTSILSDAIALLGTRYLKDNGAAALTGYYPPSSTVVLTRINREAFDYLVLGDSYLLTDENGAINPISDLRLRNSAKDLREKCMKLLQQEEVTLLAEARRELAMRELALRNTDEGYWIASLDPEAAQQAVVGSCNLVNSCSRFLAISDGLAAGYEELGVFSSWRDLFESVTSEGFPSVIEKIRREEAADPIGKVHCRPRTSDDASGILVQVRS